MRKAALLILLEKYKKDIGFFRKVDYRIEWLEKFLKTPIIESLGGEDTIPPEKFVEFLIKNLNDQKQLDTFFLQEFLKKDQNAGRLINAMLEEAEVSPLAPSEKKADVSPLAPPEKKADVSPSAPPEKKADVSAFINLPPEIAEKILGLIDPEDIRNVSETSLTLFGATRNLRVVNYWRNKFIELGCDTDFFDELVRLKLVEDYERFYNAYRNAIMARNDWIPKDDWINSRPKELWQLLCLTGEPKAIEHAFSLKGINKDIKDKMGWTMLDWAVLGNNIEALKILKEERAVDFGTKHLLSALSGDIPSIEFELQNNPLYLVNLDSPSATLRAKLRHLCDAQASGNIKAFVYLYKKLPGEVFYNYTVLPLYLGAGRSGSVAVIKHFLNLLKTNKCPIVSYFLSRLFKQLMISGPKETILFMLHWAKQNNYSIQDLADNCAVLSEIEEVELGHLNVLQLAVRYGNIEALNLLLPLCTHLKINDERENILLLAGQSGSARMIERVLDLCPQLNINPATCVNNYGMNLLHTVVQTGCLPAIKLVIDLCQKLGISLESRDKNGQTIFHYAAMAKNASAIRYLRKVCEEHKLNITPATNDYKGNDAIKNADDRIKLALTEPLSNPVQSAGPKP